MDCNTNNKNIVETTTYHHSTLSSTNHQHPLTIHIHCWGIPLRPWRPWRRWSSTPIPGFSSSGSLVTPGTWTPFWRSGGNVAERGATSGGNLWNIPINPRNPQVAMGKFEVKNLTTFFFQFPGKLPFVEPLMLQLELCGSRLLTRSRGMPCHLATGCQMEVS